MEHDAARSIGARLYPHAYNDASQFGGCELTVDPTSARDGVAGMENFAALTDEEEREFWRLYRFYWREAERCEGAKAYLAGCVMLGSALEALLTLMVNVYDEQAAATGKVPKKGKKRKPLLDWDLGELLPVAKAAGWLPAGLDLEDDWNGRKAKVGDHAEVVRDDQEPGASGKVPQRALSREGYGQISATPVRGGGCMPRVAGRSLYQSLAGAYEGRASGGGIKVR
jgi:hypothetical protein